jgi:Methyltransferase FkbM domain
VSATIIDRPETKSGAYKVPVKKLSTIFNDLNHSQIDILKMNIEGAEYNVIDDILASKIPIKQLLIEFHHRFENVGINKTKEAIQKLNTAGFLIFDISNSGEEYSFFNENFQDYL